MKLKKKEDQSVDTSIFLRRGNKTAMERITAAKCGADTEGMTTQRVPHLEIDPIYKHQTQTIVDANKCLLTGPRYSTLLRGSASA